MSRPSAAGPYYIVYDDVGVVSCYTVKATAIRVCREAARQGGRGGNVTEVLLLPDICEAVRRILGNQPRYASSSKDVFVAKVKP